MNVLTAFKLIAVIGVLAYSCAKADDAPASVADPTQPGYTSQDAAAVAALEDSARLSRSIEYAGAIFRTADGAYHYTTPVTSGSSREVEAYHIRISRTATAIALYHTHPADMTHDVTDRFSDADVSTAHALRLASYVGVLKSGRVIALEHVATRFVCLL